MKSRFAFKYILFMFLTCTLLSSCGLLNRRDFEDEMDFHAFEEPLIVPGREFEVVAGDSGRSYRSEEEIYRRTPSTERDRAFYSHKSSMKYELYSLENSQSDDEYQDYLKVRESFSTDSERIYFLRLSSKERRQYLSAKGISLEGTSWSSRRESPSSYSSISGLRSDPVNTSGSIRANGNWRRPAVRLKPVRSLPKAIELGMKLNDVENVWGRPFRRDVAGPDGAGNERWTYQLGNQVKYIYFEGGRVEGWAEQ